MRLSPERAAAPCTVAAMWAAREEACKEEPVMTHVLLEKKGNIAVATINRPKALNALNSEVLTDLDELVEIVRADSEIRGASAPPGDTPHSPGRCDRPRPP